MGQLTLRLWQLNERIALLPSTKDHAEADRRTLADFPLPICT
jgi:hypothetical protein